MTWLIRYAGRTDTAPRGSLEAILLHIRSDTGHDHFELEYRPEDAGVYVPELERPDVPDTLPDDW